MARSSLLSSSPNSPLFSSEVNSLSFIFITRQPPPLLYPPLILRSIHLSSHVPAYKHTHTHVLLCVCLCVCVSVHFHGNINMKTTPPPEVLLIYISFVCFLRDPRHLTLTMARKLALPCPFLSLALSFSMHASLEFYPLTQCFINSTTAQPSFSLSSIPPFPY